MHHLTRREFLRLTTLGTASSFVAACDMGAPPTPIAQSTEPATTQADTATSASIPTATAAPAATVAPESTVPPEATAAAQLRLPLSSDVWAWSRRITGTLPAGSSDAHLLVGDQRVDVTLEGDQFEADVMLEEGANEVVLVCTVDGTVQRSDPSTYTVRLTHRPTATIAITVENGTVVLDGGRSAPDVDSAALNEYVWSFRSTNPAPLEIRDVAEQNGAFAAERLQAAAPTVDGEYYATLRVVDEAGREDQSSSYFVVSGGAARVPDYAKEGPAWIDSSVVYGVIPNKFGDPGIPAVTERLDYLRDLGINALWFSPITVSPAGDYGYAVEDYFDVTPRFGTADDFRTLVNEAHARGIRILMDFVPNHSSDTHPYFVEAKINGKRSPYYTFYDRDASGNPTHYFDWTNLPNLNYDNPEVERWMTEAFAYWVRQFDIDGFRVDVAWGVTERKPDYWPRWREALKRIKPDLMLLAEASAREPYYFDNGFDVAYDWTAQVGNWAWKPAWESRTLTVYNLNDALTNRNLTPRSRTMHFLNNNDTGTRFITDHGEEMTRVAAALLLTVPGIPCVYTGDEVGAWYSPYYDEMPMKWDEAKYPGLVDYYRKLIGLRSATPSLRSYAWTILEARPSQPIYSYIRHAQDNSAPILVALNFSEKDTAAKLELPEEFAALVTAGTLRDILNDEDVTINTEDGPQIAMPPWKARILLT